MPTAMAALQRKGSLMPADDKRKTKMPKVRVLPEVRGRAECAEIWGGGVLEVEGTIWCFLHSLPGVGPAPPHRPGAN